MKTLLHLTTLLLFWVACSQPNKPLKLMTYNIHNGIGMDGVTDYKRIADVIIKYNADVVAIQEIDSLTERSRVFVLEEVAKHIPGMQYAFNGSIPYQGGKYGIGILSKDKPITIKAASLPGREEQRSILIAEFNTFVFCCTHLSLNEDDRLASVAIINNETAQFGNKPVVLAGDLNAIPTSVPMVEFFKSWTAMNDTAAYTIPVVNPNRCIDYILLKNPAKTTILKTEVVDEQLASDHLPVYIEGVFN